MAGLHGTGVPNYAQCDKMLGDWVSAPCSWLRGVVHVSVCIRVHPCLDVFEDPVDMIVNTYTQRGGG